MLDVEPVVAYATERWKAELLGLLHDYIRIPNVSPAYEAQWAELGHMEQAIDMLEGWCRGRPIPGMTVEVHRLPGCTPLLLVEIPPFGGGPADDTVLLYGHYDKQPEMVGWREGLGPWEPVLEGDRLYGRGGADDGYSTFASLTAIEAVQAAGGSHARCIVLIEGSEESGSFDLPKYVEALAPRLGTPSLVVCLDSGCYDYDRMWVTTSLRGLVNARLDVTISREGVHSGVGGGIIPSSFRIARRLLDRIEDADTGELLVPEATVTIPADRAEEARATAASVAQSPAAELPFVEGARPAVEDWTEQLLNRTWRPTLEVTGADGLPSTDRAGNVLRPTTSLMLSMRVPPTADAPAVADAVSRTLTADSPYGAQVEAEVVQAANGWNAPPFAEWLWSSLDRASQATFGTGAAAWGEGGSIPFIGMLGERFPAAQFVLTGVLGPASNAHGPNEFMHVPTAERLTAAIALLLHDHATRG